MPNSAPRHRFDRRDVVAGLLAVGGGLAIAYADSRPTSDSTGLTVTLLVAVAFLAAVIAGRRPWMWALLVGAWTPLVEIPASGQSAAIAALVFASIGAATGWGIARTASAAPVTPPRP